MSQPPLPGLEDQPAHTIQAQRSAVVLLSGGQDSTTTLFWAAANLDVDRILALSIHYGQRHDRELQAAQQVCRVFREKHGDRVHLQSEVLPLGPILMATSPLVNRLEKVEQYTGTEALPGGLEKTFVPGRNVLFFTLAGNRAAWFGAKYIVSGVCEEDYGGYPDCRADFIQAMRTALDMGLHVERDSHRRIEIVTPLMNLSKADTVVMAWGLPGCLEAMAFTHTCYNGGAIPCGSCHACLLRGRGFREAKMEDPMVARLKRECLLPPEWDYPV